MTIFIQSLDYSLWDLIVDSPSLPATTNASGVIIHKPKTTHNDDDGKKLQMNTKAKHVLIFAIKSNNFNRLSSCFLAKDMWDRLEVVYEGTNPVKEDTVSMLIHDYEIFIIHENEDIKTMFTRFTNIINSLQTLDKTYTNREMVRKFLGVYKEVGCLK
ncbi:UBN2 domain-containing protein [Cephalotus follicularis]|uniref:UBN2 domain-containing protein n=1 Tax=Cephalotus follicularis TaxID=3775 RepID=A0A1Q3BH37_CEPFO|nr:UBN2 domain-containing protein [Cephalotus follicularis]